MQSVYGQLRRSEFLKMLQDISSWSVPFLVLPVTGSYRLSLIYIHTWEKIDLPDWSGNCFLRCVNIYEKITCKL
jgi:hypothetical protein